MKKQEADVRKKVLKIRMSATEMEQLKKLQEASTEKDTSNYVRSVALRKPVIVTYRNKSADDFLQEMLQLRKELNGIGNNFNQAVHKLHILDKIPEFRSWLQQNDVLQKTLIAKVEEIKKRMSQLYDQWLQK